MAVITIILLICLISQISSHPTEFSVEEKFSNNQSCDTLLSKEEYRLSDKLWPSHYEVKITPHFEEVAPGSPPFSFDGQVTITFHATKPIQEIVLHANNLEIDNDSWEVRDQDDHEVPRGEKFSYQNETHKVTFPLKADLILNVDYKIKIKYKGYLEDSMVGFYRSHYNEENKVKWLGTTQFQTTDARRAFPCFDEPKFKARFSLIVVRPADYQPTIANTKNIANRTIGEGLVEEHFAVTPIMSCYLLVFIVSMLKGVRTDDQSFGVYARPDALNQTGYALDVGPKLLDKIGEYLDYPYNKVTEIQKMDMIAVPDFFAGAMENWGAMPYKETALLWDIQESGITWKQRIATTMMHEFAHLYFGDLVTCDWWSYAWLHEAFARYFQYFATELVEKNWSLEEQFVVEQVQFVFQIDSTDDTHPMTNPDTYTSEDAANQFDNISYNKGASIVRWMRHHMGETNFQKAVQNYLKRYQFKTAVPDNLFREFELAAPDSKITQTFTLWTEKSGYPLVTVRKEGNELILTQRRFLIDDPNPEDLTLWPIPITFATNKADFEITKTREIFPRIREEFRTNIEDGDLDFYILNVQQVGYYRVNYETSNWEAIKRALLTADHGGIHVLNRAQIIDDLFNLARSGIHSYEFAFEIIDYLRNERNYIPWFSAINGLTYLSRRIVSGADYENFKIHINSLLDGIYKHLGFLSKAEEDHIDTLNRVAILNWACKYQNEDCIKKSKEEFTKLKTGTDYRVQEDIRGSVYCTAIREGTREDFEFLWRKFLTSNVAHEQITILNSLGCTKSSETLFILLDKILTEDIRPQDKSSTFNSAVNGNNENINIIIEYLSKNWQRWEPVMGPVGSAFATLSGYFTNEEQIRSVEAFKTANPTLSEDNVRRIDNGLTVARKNIEWDSKRVVEVQRWLKNRYNGAASSITLSVTLVTITMMIAAYIAI